MILKLYDTLLKYQEKVICFLCLQINVLWKMSCILAIFRDSWVQSDYDITRLFYLT